MSSSQVEIHGALIEACRKNDRKAQQQVYKLYAKAMYNICMRITNHSAEAEDILQESFLDAFQKIQSFKGDSTFGAWLKRIVVNRSINVLKRRKAAFVPVEEMDFKEENESINEEEQQYQIEQVHRAIQQLPDGFRVVLTLYLLEGYDHKEIAEILNITESTSKSQFNRAKKRLLEILKVKR